jgi:hypothetical protein
VLGHDTCRACFTGDYPVTVEKHGARIEKNRHFNGGKYAYI